MGGETFTVLRLRLMHKLAMSPTGLPTKESALKYQPSMDVDFQAIYCLDGWMDGCLDGFKKKR